jgi:hypothetical protein
MLEVSSGSCIPGSPVAQALGKSLGEPDGEVPTPPFNVREDGCWKLKEHLQRFRHQQKSYGCQRVLLYRLGAQPRAPKERTA